MQRLGIIFILLVIQIPIITIFVPRLHKSSQPIHELNSKRLLLKNEESYPTSSFVPQEYWKFKNFDVEKWDQIQSINLRDGPLIDDTQPTEYFKNISNATIVESLTLYEMRIGSSIDVMDAYIIQESNYTTFGTPRKLEIYERLSIGWLRKYQNKLIYVLLSHFNEKWTENGWLAESYIRNHMSLKGLPMISDKHDDDLFLLFDSDEIPNRSVLLFLKLYEGYTEPINLLYDSKTEKLLQLYNACTIGMLRKVYGNNAMLLRKNAYKHKKLKKEFRVYVASHDVKVWNIGTLGHYAGYHCSWCFQPEGIRRKLLSAQKNDKPRWGDYPEKTNLTYIQKLIKSGEWFDGTHPYIRAQPLDKYYAPSYDINKIITDAENTATTALPVCQKQARAILASHNTHLLTWWARKGVTVGPYGGMTLEPISLYLDTCVHRRRQRYSFTFFSQVQQLHKALQLKPREDEDSYPGHE
ncbi:MGAT3 [Lepeophtheirus salmonis]|uniref:MGAT3 n=1 Tax=Lepeophtheirus salmonis TaxID=72036 RepID=A0A7R8H7F8_LEPSM|nr:MGAT3 [Lepeophtheirus salmonis]CAF2922514.1 MGAT3 [Lepeophtheirus salmonis]